MEFLTDSSYFSMNANSTIWMILLLPLLVAIFILPGLKRWTRISALLATGAAFISLALALLFAFSEVGPGETSPLPWILTGEGEDSFRILIGLETDRLARIGLITVTAIGFFAHLFCLSE